MSALSAEDIISVDEHVLLADEGSGDALNVLDNPADAVADIPVEAPAGAAPDIAAAEDDAFPGERVALTDELTIHVAGERVAQLQHALHRCGALTVDLSGITEIDTAGVQVLAFIRREAATRDRPLVYVDHSPVVLDALQLLGLDLQLETAVKPGARP